MIERRWKIMIDIKKILLEVCDDKRVLDPNIDLIEEGIIDSLAFIELFDALSNSGVDIQPTQVKKDDLRSIKNIEELIKRVNNKKKD